MLLCMTSSIFCLHRVKKDEKKAKRGSIELNAAIGSQLTLLNTYERDRKTEFKQLAHNQKMANIQLETLNTHMSTINLNLKQIASSLILIVQHQAEIPTIESYCPSHSSDFTSSEEESPEPTKLPVTIITGRPPEQANRPSTSKQKSKTTVNKSDPRRRSDLIKRGKVKNLKQFYESNSD